MLGFGPRKGKRRKRQVIAVDRRLKRLAPAMVRTLQVVVTVGLVAAATWGLKQAESAALQRPEFTVPVTFELSGAPDWLRDLLLQNIADLSHLPWIDTQLPRLVHERLADNGWVRKIQGVSKPRRGVVRVDCEYRLPVAQVQHGEYFYFIDEYAVRLPGRYGFRPGWLMLQGVASPAPQVGRTWPGEDIAAGSRLANLLDSEPYLEQIASILVHNYSGRRDAYATHIEVVTSRQASRILWGSAPGEELEENSVAQKLGILRENYRRYGGIDANRPTIDISVFPDRFIVPT